MIDYEKWLERAVAFMEGLKELPGDVNVQIQLWDVLTPSQLAWTRKSCPLPIPRPLERFLSTVPLPHLCKYWWDTPTAFGQLRSVAFPQWRMTHIWGGPILDRTLAIGPATATIVATAGSMDYSPCDQRFWGNSLPLISEENGDLLALYVGDNLVDPPVAYLNHEGCGASAIIAHSFDAFLEAWERLHYIGLHFLTSFCNRQTGLLDPNAFPVQLEALDCLFRGEVRDDLTVPSLKLTENEWATASQPDVLLEWLEAEARIDRRQLRLFGCACCRRVWSELNSQERHAIEVAEQFADGKADEGGLMAVRTAACEQVNHLDKLLSVINTGEEIGKFLKQAAMTARANPYQSAVCAAIDASRFVTGAIWSQWDDPRRSIEIKAQADLVRHIVGNPFAENKSLGTLAFNTLRTASRLYKGEPCSAELAAQLRKAGHHELAEHFQRPDHPKGCWVLDLILGN